MGRRVTVQLSLKVDKREIQDETRGEANEVSAGGYHQSATQETAHTAVSRGGRLGPARLIAVTTVVSALAREYRRPASLLALRNSQPVDPVGTGRSRHRAPVPAS